MPEMTQQDETPRKQAPRIIYLQDGEDAEPAGDYDGVTWCQDSINDSDTKYIRFDQHERELAAAIDAARKGDSREG